MTIKINGTNTAANPSITGTDTDTGIVYGSDQIDFSTGGSSKLTLNGQNLGLGTSSPNVSGFNTDAQVLTLAGNYRGFIELKGNTQAADSIGGIRFYSANNLEAEILSVTDGSYNGDLRFITNGSERMRLLSSGGMTFNGDTAADNALDDYEEGSWTPSNPNGGYTFNSVGAYYTKIGNMVNYFLHCTLSLIPNNNNVFEIHGLPYTSSSAAHNYGWHSQVVYSSNANDATIANMRALVNQNSTYVYFHTVGLGTGARVMNSTVRAAMQGQNIILAGTYRAA